MFIPASSEFVALCKSQVAVLTQGLGAALSAVYLAEELVEGTQAKLIPVVVYPEATGVWEEEASELLLPELEGKIDSIPRLSRAIPRLLPQVSDNDQTVGSTSPDWDDNFLQRQRQVVLPLMHEGVVMGLLVTSREDRAWNETEKATIERIARTLAIAYMLDRRRVWFEQQLTQSKRLQAQQRDRLDDLLHQLRNPLTALRTFGKLLLRRLLPGDKNQELASSILRESDRLQELLKEFDAELEASEGELAPLRLQAATVLEASPTRDNQGEIVPTANSLPPAHSLPIESFSVAQVLEPLLVSARAIAQERNLELQAEIQPHLPIVRGNAKGLREVLSNLIDNALKYTPAGGQIDIRVGVFARTPREESRGSRGRGEAGGEEDKSRGNKGIGEAFTFHWIENSPPTPPASSAGDAANKTSRQEQRLAILISDTGPGIPLQDLEHLFERHYRGVQASTAIPGSGLGLAIAKDLIEQMQGEIEVFSPAQLAWAKLGTESTITKVQDNSTRGTSFIVWLMIQ